MTHCTFSGNSADSGGGICSSSTSRVTLTGCVFIANTAVTRGAGMFNWDSIATVTNCTFSANSAGFDGGGMFNDHSAPAVANSVFWNNAGGQISGYPADVRYSNVEDGCAGEGNIDADPLFVDPANGDYHLSAGSPCIDAADNAAVPADEFDLDEDGDTEEPLPFDLDWNPRFVDDPDTQDTGYGTPPIVDMGAYEFQPPDCPADFDDDGDVDTADLLFLLGAWGTPDGDVDGDGDTDTADLLALLAAWGECP